MCKKKEKISIIVPVYNVQKYLKKCVDSIINQTYKNLEIILVDDGSTDTSGKICDNYKEIDSRIKVIHKTNGGLSDARNKGIEFATGKYISFVDSDDFLKDDMYSYLYELIENNNSDISICSYYKFREENEILEELNEENIEVYDSKSAIKELLAGNKIQDYAWNKLYKRTLFSNISYPYGKKMEDLGTTYLLFSKSNNIVVGNCKKYYYLQRNDSIVNQEGYDLNIDKYELALERYRFIKSIYPEMSENYLNILEKILRLYRIKDKNIEKYIENKDVIGVYKDILKNRNFFWKEMNFSLKLKMRIFNFSPKIYRKL